MTRTIPGRLLGIVSAAALVFTMTAVPAGADNSGQAHPATIFAFNYQYFHVGDAPGVLTIKQGEKFSFGNYDPAWGVQAHSLTEIVPNCTAPPHTGTNCRYPTFSSGLVDHGYVHNVAGADKLRAGTYQFNCQVHAFMKGTLVVK